MSTRKIRQVVSTGIPEWVVIEVNRDVSEVAELLERITSQSRGGNSKESDSFLLGLLHARACALVESASLLLSQLPVEKVKED